MGRSTVRRVVCAVVLGTALLLTGCAGDAGDGPAEQAPAATPQPATPPTTQPDPTTTAPGAVQALPVYYVSDTDAGLRLYREFHRVAGDDAASDAVREMLGDPLDPDYRTLWPGGTELVAPVTADGGEITVDLSADALDGTGLGSAAAQAAADQLVLTVQAALQSSDPVRLLIDGDPVPELWGAVATADPLPRPDVYAVRSLVQIDRPAHGATTGTTVSVGGEAAVFEANVPWQVLGSGGEVVQEGFTTAAEGQRFSHFSFVVTLPPGEYTVRVTEDDPSDGEGRPPFVDDKQITVVE